jgi:GT2 family glycosyltransferase
MSTILPFLIPRAARRPRTPAPAARTLTLDPGLAPIHTLDLELAAPASVRPAGRESADWSKITGSLLALVRLHGSPLGFVQATVDEPGEILAALSAAARRELAGQIARHEREDLVALPGTAGPDHRPVARCMRRRLAVLADAPPISVIVATRERPDALARCLDSLIRMPYPNLEIIVVDNAPETDRAERLVRERYAETVTYVREPHRGLASAHNRGLREAGGRIIAFTDDDVIADREWPAALAEAFTVREDVGCVTGLIVPAELETPAQIMLEAEGGFTKTFEQRSHYLGHPDAGPLFPFTVGQLGSGANMAFDAALLRRFGGFDPATGTGSAARGGDDLLAFFRTIAAGRSLVYQPTAVIWHHHRRTLDALKAQAYGYGVGLGAYLTAALAHEPRMLPGLIRRLPRGIAYELEHSRPSLCDPAVRPARLAAAQRMGLLYGPLAYARARRECRARRRADGRP